MQTCTFRTNSKIFLIYVTATRPPGSLSTRSKMTLVELASSEELQEFLNANSEQGSVVTFSATWCGPCKGSKPKLKELAGKSPLPIGYVHEEDIEDFLEIFVQIKAFPTYIVFKNGEEKARVEGVNFEALEKMILDHTMA